MSGATVDLAIVGAGIVGQSLAWHAAQRGRSVAVFERSGTPLGASIRNFGLIWPIGQPAGPRFDLALDSLGHWQRVAAEAGLDLRRTGSLHLAYRAEEVAVLEEFAADHTSPRHDCRLLSAAEALARAPVARPDGLKAALWSGTEAQVSSPSALARLARHLATRSGVAFHWRHAVTAVEPGMLRAGDTIFRARRIVVCPGADLDTLFPGLLRDAGLRPVRLQMLAALPDPARGGTALDLGPALCAGLTLLHYPAFADCASLPALRRVLAADCAQAIDHGIHILLSQHEGGELIIGDSHDYAPDASPFNSEAVDRLILDHLARMTALPPLSITRRWQGVYVSAPDAPFLRVEPCDGVTVLTGLGGAGMTLSFGVTGRLCSEIFDD